MRGRLGPYLRAFQVRFPGLFGMKNALQRGIRRVLRKPFDGDFAALAALRLPRDGMILDIGGNRGQSIDAIRLFLPDARIVSFEPNPHLAEQLRALFAGDRGVEVKTLALGNEPAVLTLHVPYYNGWMFDGLASLDRSEAENWLTPKNLAGFRPDKLTIETIECAVEPLDSVEGLAPAFVKIDVQGFEPQVLDGARETLSRHRPVVMLETGADVDMLQHLPAGYEPAHWDGSRLVRGFRLQPNVFYMPVETAERLFGQAAAATAPAGGAAISARTQSRQAGFAPARLGKTLVGLLNTGGYRPATATI